MASSNANKPDTTAKIKMVKIKLPKTKEQQGDQFVSVNNETFQIKRGVSVEVPEYVAEVLRHSEEMTEAALDYINEVAD